MSYQVNFSETTNPSKLSITVQDKTLETVSTSLSFVGKNYAGYAQPIAENFLHLLENFAKNSSPDNPVQGQLWYDNSPDVNLVKVFDSTNWVPVGGVKKGASAPEVANSINGDLWVDTTNHQLNLFTGSNWALIGPEYSSGARTGPVVETIIDTRDKSHNVIVFYASDPTISSEFRENRVAIISSAAFTPKTTLAGFAAIGQGINISTEKFYNTDETKFWGRASEADALNINGDTVGSINFLRSDVTSTTNYPFNIRNNGGISIGSDLNFSIFTGGNSTTLYSRTSGNSYDIKLNSNGTGVSAGIYTAVRIDANGRVGIGVNNTNPQAVLDVSVNNVANTLGIITNGKVKIEDVTDSSGLDVTHTASLWTDGGLSVKKSSNFGSIINSYGLINVIKLDANNNPTTGAVISPGPSTLLDSAVNKKYDIGTANRSFRNIYAETFIGNLQGNITGSLTGNISGSASKLASPTAFSIVGEVASSNVVNFDGQSGPATFSTQITQSIITNRTSATTSLNQDQLLIYRVGTGLLKTTKQDFVNSIPSVPIGAIMTYAGATPPAGYLLCDGSEVDITTYSALYAVIGFTYKASADLIGKSTFALPDLRGRFGLGRDNMNNNISVPSKTNPAILVNTVTGPAYRVNDINARTLGGKSGGSSKVLLEKNLPDHKHDLKSDNGYQYYAWGKDDVPPDNSPGVEGTNYEPGREPYIDMYLLRNSGGVESSDALGQAFDVMNPYLTINYIIYTGVGQ